MGLLCLENLGVFIYNLFWVYLYIYILIFYRLWGFFFLREFFIMLIDFLLLSCLKFKLKKRDKNVLNVKKLKFVDFIVLFFFYLFLKYVFFFLMFGICMIGWSWFDILLRSVLLIGYWFLYKCKSFLLYLLFEGMYKGIVSMKLCVYSKYWFVWSCKECLWFCFMK